MAAPVGDEGMWVGDGERCIWRRVGVRMSKKYFAHEREPRGGWRWVDYMTGFGDCEWWTFELV
jgi:hypothetical protein